MDAGKSTALPHHRLSVAERAGDSQSWYEHDIKTVELRVISAHLGARMSRLNILLAPLLALNCDRSQVQPLLEQAWTRLETLRERIADARLASANATLVSAIARAEALFETWPPTILAQVDEAFEQAFTTCAEAVEDAARLRALQALIAAVSFNFRRAIALSQEAAELASATATEQWHYHVQQAQFLLDQGREFNDAKALQVLLRLCENPLLPSAPTPTEQAWVYDCQGQALGILGRQQSGTANLDQAVRAFEAALALRDRQREPYQWAAAQNHLANAIGTLGQRQLDTALLKRAASTFEAALEVPISNAAPDHRASVQNNLAAVLQTLGRQHQDAQLLEQAVAAYKAVLAVWTAQRRPLFWAATQANLGAALRLLGNMRKEPGLLEQSISAYRSALKIRTRERTPRAWALAQNDMGAALQAHGEQAGDTLNFGRAIAAYREALKEIDRDNEPITWAMTMANLGVARRKLAEYTYDVAVSRRAVADIRMALDIFRSASHPRWSEFGLEQLAIAMEVNAELEVDDND